MGCACRLCVTHPDRSEGVQSGTAAGQASARCMIMKRMLLRTDFFDFDFFLKDSSRQRMAAHAQAEVRNQLTSERTLVSGVLEGWDACGAFPLASVRASLGQAGELATETKVQFGVCVFSTVVCGAVVCTCCGYDLIPAPPARLMAGALR